MELQPLVSSSKVESLQLQTHVPVLGGSLPARLFIKLPLFTHTWWSPPLGVVRTACCGSGFWPERSDSTNCGIDGAFPYMALQNSYRLCCILLKGLMCVWLLHCVAGTRKQVTLTVQRAHKAHCFCLVTAPQLLLEARMLQQQWHVLHPLTVGRS